MKIGAWFGMAPKFLMTGFATMLMDLQDRSEPNVWGTEGVGLCQRTLKGRNMSKAVGVAKFMSAAVNGIIKAQKDYAHMSGGNWLWEAPEYLSTTYVAREISKVAGAEGPWFLTLEHSAKKAIRDAGAAGRGRLHGHIRHQGRFDLLLWWGSENPRAPIEIKCQVNSFEKIRADCDRVEKVIHLRSDKSTFQFGMIVFYLSTKSTSASNAKQKIEKQIANIIDDVLSHVSLNTIVKTRQSRVTTSETSAWSSVAIAMLRRK